MDWLLSNWIWIAFGVAMIAMHMFGHGGHGGHGGHTRPDPERANDTKGPPAPEHAHTVNTGPNAVNSDNPAPLGVPARTGQDAPTIPKDRGRHHHKG